MEENYNLPGTFSAIQMNAAAVRAWVQVSKLAAEGLEPGDRFGSVVAVSGDTAVVGVSDDDDGKDDYALRSAADVVTALHALPYSEQLVRKRKTLYDALIKLPTEMKHSSKSLPEAQRFAFRKLPWLDANNIKENGGTVCPLSEVIPATLQHGYRNKCDFSFGLDS